jgi:leucine dehydrogenase
MAIRGACERIWGTDSLAERSISVIGLGSVGARLARLLADGGARLVVADIVPDRRQIAEEIGATWTDPASALAAEVDVVAPCALGGTLNEETLPLLACRAIAGAANNQLSTEAIGASLAERGILWVPDFVANAGGIINISVEFEPEGYDASRAETRVRAIADTVRTVLDHAAATGTTPLEAALAVARRRLVDLEVVR